MPARSMSRFFCTMLTSPSFVATWRETVSSSKPSSSSKSTVSRPIWLRISFSLLVSFFSSVMVATVFCSSCSSSCSCCSLASFKSSFSSSICCFCSDIFCHSSSICCFSNSTWRSWCVEPAKNRTPPTRVIIIRKNIPNTQTGILKWIGFFWEWGSSITV